jgi:hypothetical protein
VPIEELCGDQIVSRNYNEVYKRQLRKQDIMKVKGVIQERRQTQKVEDVGQAGNGAVLQVRTNVKDDDSTRERTVSGYLSGLEMYLLAHVLNGMERLDPQPVEPERADTEPTAYWHFPLSFAIAYVNRAKVYANSLPAGSAFAQLRQRDEEERAIWVHRHRMSDTMPLGKIAKQVFDETTKLLLPLHEGATAARREGGGATGSTKERQQAEQIAALKASNLTLKRKQPTGGAPGGKGDGKGGKGAKRAKIGGNPVTLDALLNGTALCAAWNKGSCTAATCPNGQKHACNGKMKNRSKAVACGRNHKSIECIVCMQK